MDPDPAKCSGSGWIRIRNAGHTFLTPTGPTLRSHHHPIHTKSIFQICFAHRVKAPDAEPVAQRHAHHPLRNQHRGREHRHNRIIQVRRPFSGGLPATPAIIYLVL